MFRNDIIAWVMNELEGGDKLISDTGGLTKYGISSNANPTVDIANLTEAQAIQIYIEKYWIASEADKYPFPYNLILFDTQVNCGRQMADIIKYAMSQSSTPAVLLLHRLEYYSNLMKGKTKYDIYAEGWLLRIIKIFRKLVEEGVVNAAPINSR
jgi:lysozyme family protein